MATHSNVYINGLPHGLDDDSFRQLFEGYGSVTSVKLFAQNRYGFVKFETVEEAQNVVDALNGSSIGDNILTVKFANNDQGMGGQKKGGADGLGSWGAGGKGWVAVLPQPAAPVVLPKQMAIGNGAAPGRGDQVYIKGLPLEFSDDNLFEVFSGYGTVVWHKVLKKAGAYDSAALVQMGSESEAQMLVEHLNGNIPQGLEAPVHVSFCTPSKSKGGGGGKADKGAGKMAPRFAPYEAAAGADEGRNVVASVGGAASPLGGWTPKGAGGGGKGGFSNEDDQSNLYIKGLPTTTDELYLYKLFAPFGAITSVRPIVQEWGAIGFVKYVEPSAAQVAIANLSGQTLADGSEIHVSIKTPKGSR